MLPMNITEVIINKHPLETMRLPLGEIMITMSQHSPLLSFWQKCIDINCKTQHDFRNDKSCISEWRTFRVYMYYIIF